MASEPRTPIAEMDLNDPSLSAFSGTGSIDTSMMNVADTLGSATENQVPSAADSPLETWAKAPSTWAGTPHGSDVTLTFRVRHQDRPTRRLRLSGNRYTIGSGVGCSIRLDDPSLSPLHAVLIRDRERILVRAYSIPFQLNQSRVTEASLEIGDRLRLGDYEFELLDNEAPASSAVTRAIASDDVGAHTQYSEAEANDFQAWQHKFADEAKQWRTLKHEVERRDAWCRSRERELLAQQKQLDASMEALQQRQDELQTQESAAIEVHHEFEKRTADLLRRQRELELQQEELATGREHLRLQQERLDGRDRLHRQQIETLLSEQERLIHQDAISQQQLDESDARLRAAQLKAEKASAAVEQMRAKFASLNEQLLQLGQQQESLQQLEAGRSADHRLKLQALTAERDEALAQRDELEQKHDQFVDATAEQDARRSVEHQQQLQELTAAKDEALAKLDEIEKEYQQLLDTTAAGDARRNEEYEQQLKELAAARDEARAQRDEAQQEHDRVVDAKAESDARRARLEERCAELESTESRLLIEIEELRAEIAQTKEDAESLDRECQLAKKSVADLQEALHDNRARQETDRESWNDEVDELRSSVEDLSLQLAAAQKQISELTERNELLAKQIGQTESERDEAIQQRVLAEEQRQESEEKRNVAEEDAQTAREQVADLTAQRDRAKREVEDTRALFDRSNRDHDDTLERIEQLERESRELVDRPLGSSGVSQLGREQPDAAAVFSMVSLSQDEQPLADLPDESETASPPTSMLASAENSNAVIESDSAPAQWNRPTENEEPAGALLEAPLDAGTQDEVLNDQVDQQQPTLGWSTPQDLEETPTASDEQAKSTQETEPGLQESPLRDLTTNDDQADAWPTYQLAEEPGTDIDIDAKEVDQPGDDADDFSLLLASRESIAEEPGGAGQDISQTDIAKADLPEWPSESHSHLLPDEQIESYDPDAAFPPQDDDAESGSLAQQLIADLQDESQVPPTNEYASEFEDESDLSDPSAAIGMVDASHEYDSETMDQEQTYVFDGDDEFGDAFNEPQVEGIDDRESIMHTAQFDEQTSFALPESEALNREEEPIQTPSMEANDYPDYESQFESGGVDEPSVDDPSLSLPRETDSHFLDEPDAVEPLGMPAPSQAALPDSMLASDDSDPDEDSIEAYMNRLLQRVQGQPGTPTAPAPVAPKVPAKDAAPVPATKPVQESFPVEDVNDGPVQPEQATEPAAVVDLDAPLVPRSQAPERHSNLSAMRELANESARSAITRSQKTKSRSTRSQAMTKFGYAGIAIACAMALFVFLQGHLLIKGAAVAAALIFAAITIKEAFSLMTQLVPTVAAQAEPEQAE